MIGILNNEALCLIAIQSILALKPRLNIANSYLIAPLVFDKKILGHLKRKTTDILSAQEMVTENSSRFIGFNEKFNDSLIVSTNAIAMGLELGLFDLKGGELVLATSDSFYTENLGHKFDDFIRASENVAKILAEPPSSLYALLRIEV
ncbi:three component ABC system middle component [Halopseudomonas maritima]|uniref:three component ABC system middle component n=1 Tax=Halopseudomonas maritima TaxID=2918528 RepID=UPI001EEA50B9|nr:three component ABC system middle component [Halopseudomonas maritima]UJJ33057.1 hypothetical protein HV822_07900 [Halopseudomonas maritima]